MESTKTRVMVILWIVVSLLLDAIFAQDRIEMKCNPGIRHRFEVCPESYCCVRDEFLPTYVYCRKIGLEDENCTTRDNESECPCAAGLYCKPNIASQFQSLYGRCYNASRDATTTPPPTATTPTSTMTTLPTIVTSDPTQPTVITTVPTTDTTESVSVFSNAATTINTSKSASVSANAETTTTAGSTSVASNDKNSSTNKQPALPVVPIIG